MAGNVDSSDISEAIKEYLLPFTTQKDGVRVPISLVQLVDGTKRPIPFVSGSAPWGNGVNSLYRDATLNDSDKTITVPSGKLWRLRYIHAELTTTATVGNRVLKGFLSDGTNIFYAIPPTSVVAASKDSVLETFMTATYTTTVAQVPQLDGSNPDVATRSPMPDVILSAGSTIRIYDSAAVDPAADDLLVVITYQEYDA